MKYAVCAQKVLEDRIPNTEKRKEERRHTTARKREVKADKEKRREDRQV